MYRSEVIQIKLEFDRSIKYLDSRKEELTTEECLQEIGHLRMFINDAIWHGEKQVKEEIAA